MRNFFRVRSAKANERPPGAHVAIQYKGYWFYIDDIDQETKSTFSLLMELRTPGAGREAWTRTAAHATGRAVAETTCTIRHASSTASAPWWMLTRRAEAVSTFCSCRTTM